jgi:hypothetical protein
MVLVTQIYLRKLHPGKRLVRLFEWDLTGLADQGSRGS